MHLFGLLHCQVDSLPTASPGKLFFKFIFGYAGSSLLHGLFCSCSKQGLLSSWGARGLSLRWLLLFWSMGSRAHVSSADVTPGLQSTSSVVVPCGLGCSTACGIFPDQGSNSCLRHLQMDSFTPKPRGKPVTWDSFN